MGKKAGRVEVEEDKMAVKKKKKKIKCKEKSRGSFLLKNGSIDIVRFKKWSKEYQEWFDANLKECYRSLGRIEASIEADDRLTEELKRVLKENEAEHKKDLKELKEWQRV